MDKLRLMIVNSHYLIVTKEGKNLLVDTGSPVSFCNEDQDILISLGDKEYVIQTNQFLADKINNAGLIDVRVDALLGMDVLCQHSFSFDKSENTVVVDVVLDEISYNHSAPIEIKDLMGQKCVMMEAKINQKSVRTILDTGAWISYLSSSYLNGVEEKGTIKDYNPIIGDIRTTKHEVELSIGDMSQIVDVAKMPSTLEMMMRMIGVGFVMGLDSIESDRICIDFRKGTMLY